MTAGVAPLHGAVAAQGCALPTTSAQRTHRRLLCASRASAKTSVCVAVKDARMGRVVRWKRLVCVKYVPQVVNGLGPCPLLLHGVNEHEKRGDGAAIVGWLGCGWFMRVAFLGAPGARASGNWKALLVLVGVLALGGTRFARNPDR